MQRETHVYLIRHGESAGNARDAFLGHTDLDLTALGKAQAEQTADYLRLMKVDAVYASDLLRAYHTAQATASRLGLPIIKDERLREIYCGEWEDVPFSVLAEKYKESYGVWCNNIGLAKTDGGESVLELQNRVVAAATEIAQKNEGKTVLIFTHATPIRCFAGYCEGKDMENLKEIPWASNASVTHAVYKEGKFTLVEYSKDDFLGKMATRLPDNV